DGHGELLLPALRAGVSAGRGGARVAGRPLGSRPSPVWSDPAAGTEPRQGQAMALEGDVRRQGVEREEFGLEGVVAGCERAAGDGGLEEDDDAMLRRRVEVGGDGEHVAQAD